jgi:hypothetical protein
LPARSLYTSVSAPFAQRGLASGMNRCANAEAGFKLNRKLRQRSDLFAAFKRNNLVKSCFCFAARHETVARVEDTRGGDEMKTAYKVPGLFLAFALALACGETTAQSYPNRPMRMVIPLTTGGGVDIVGRIVAAKMSEGLGQPSGIMASRVVRRGQDV